MIDELRRALAVAPVMGRVHPLLPLCLPPEAEVAVEARPVALAMDALAAGPAGPVLITQPDRAYEDRFLTLNLTEPPDAELVNAGLPGRLPAARALLTHHGVADRIAGDARTRGYRTVALLLVDGLSYDDVAHWPEGAEPVFIDGPSITFYRRPDGTIARDVGFPAIVGRPPLAQRLGAVGLGRARGYAYWERGSNDVAAVLFEGMPLARVGSVTEALALLEEEPLDGLYIQMVRIGTDGLAHGRREVSRREVEATVAAVRADLHRLVDMMARQGAGGAVYLTSDHGMLWKQEHALRPAGGAAAASPRYAVGRLPDDAPATCFEAGPDTFSLYHYPYLGATLRANNSGVHGGLSYWESIVPLVRIEVNP